ncbi:MAG: 4-(cytidine 5'-diphospho)-2-C-methyl-D-erythritol kinase [Acidobacteria bacterium]|nr:4-(cytidine 5'-diphospho)-2-C-methyl-D-erythritol kinase [Acidobacteriota bacterium]
MSVATRRARVTALAKLNLGLKVLHRRSDGFHELRTVFQTISLGDRLEVEFTPGRRAEVELDSAMEIADNLVIRAARLVMEMLKIRGAARFRLVKRIPMGAGLGGGSSDAAAVLVALPVLAGKRPEMEQLLELGARLGSDVPFFLLGGMAVALGRGTELYPLPDAPERSALVVAPPVHVSTAEAYRALRRGLTAAPPARHNNKFQALVWRVGGGVPQERWEEPLENDFESVVFDQYPQLKSIKRKLRRLGARSAMLTGSGAALFGLFRSPADAARAAEAFEGAPAFPVRTVSRARYRAMWWRSLGAHLSRKEWPPVSRYS